MSGVNVGTAYLEIIPSAKGFAGKLQQQVGGDVAKSGEEAGRRYGSGFGKSVKAFAGTIGGFFALEKGVDFLKDSVKAASANQQAQAVLTRQLHNTTGATKEQAKAVDEWLVKTAEASGIAKEELTPSLTKLATATGSVTKSQSLLKLAMNVSAGTGRSLKSVTDGLVRAQNGSVGGLSRLGIATKDAHGKSLSFLQIQKDLAKRFRGDTAAAADTTAGKMRRLSVTWEEMKVQVGEKLMPILASLAQTVIDKIVPAVERFFDQWKSGEGTAGMIASVLAKVGDVLGTVFGFLSQHKETVKTFVVVLGTLVGIVKVWTLAQAALDAVLSANPIGLVVIAIAALVTGLIMAYRHSETFRSIVNAAFHAVGVAIGFVKDHWKIFLTAFLAGFGPIGLAIALLITHFNAVKDVARTVFKLIIDAFLLVVGALIDGAAKAFGWVPGIGGKLKSAADAFDSFRDRVNAALDGIHSEKDIHINVVSTKQSIAISSINKPRVPHGATGGIVTRPTLALIGEAGPEAVVPLNRTPGSSPLPAAGGSSVDSEQTAYRAFSRALANSNVVIMNKSNLDALDLLVGTA